MKTPIPRLDETPVELKQLLDPETEVRKPQRLQALYLLQTEQARTRRQVARRLGVSRHTVGRWLAAYAAGGVARMLTMAKAPGNTPLVPPAVRQALTQRLAQPEGFASDKAIWHWRQHDYGLAIAYQTVHRLVRYQWRAKLKVPRKSPIKKP
jgi:transposase